MYCHNDLGCRITVSVDNLSSIVDICHNVSMSNRGIVCTATMIWVVGLLSGGSRGGGSEGSTEPPFSNLQ